MTNAQVLGHWRDLSWKPDSAPFGFWPVALLLEAAVPDLSQTAEENSPGERVACLAFVESRMDTAAQLDALQPGEDEQGSFNPTQLAQCNRKAVLSRVAAQLAEHERSRHGALFDRRGEAEDLVPMSADGFEVEGPSDHGRKRRVFDLAARKVQPSVAQVADARREAETEQMHEGEDAIGEACRIGVVLLDPQVGFMM